VTTITRPPVSLLVAALLGSVGVAGCTLIAFGVGAMGQGDWEPAPTAQVAADPTVVASTGFAPSGSTEIALVTTVVDGDTVWVDVLGEESRVRYIGIDTPELARDDQPGEPFGIEARTANAAMLEDAIVVLETDVSETDDFGRLLRHVWLPPDLENGTTDDDMYRLVSLDLVRAGLAEARDYPPDTKHSALLDAAEEEARAASRGIWSGG
jgi:micrococcal nuclease